MRLYVKLAVAFAIVVSVSIAVEEVAAQEAPPWAGNYPMSFFVKARSAKTVGKDHLSVSFKSQWTEYDQQRNAQGGYDRLDPGDSYRRRFDCLVAKYGWAEDHHLAFGIPFLSTDYHVGTTDLAAHGLANVFLFEKWNFLKETWYLPAVAFDTWIFLPTGSSARKLGRSDCCVRFTSPISKAWERVSLHVHPGYTINCGRGPNLLELNGALLLTPTKKFWPAVEYNYLHREGKGVSHDFIPGFIWKYTEGASLKLGAVINADSSMSFKDHVGLVGKVFYRF